MFCNMIIVNFNSLCYFYHTSGVTEKKIDEQANRNDGHNREYDPEHFLQIISKTPHRWEHRWNTSEHE